MFKFEEQAIKGVFVITPQVFGDSRGYFAETFKAPDFEAVGIPTVFVQDNESCSSKGVLRCLHFQKEHTQGKLGRVTSGSVYDPTSEGGIPWNDPDLAVEWPKLDCEYKTSEKDGKHPGFKEQSFDWAEKWR